MAAGLAAAVCFSLTTIPVAAQATPTGPDAGLAASWIASQLVAAPGGGSALPNGNDGIDWGTTIDAAFALASAGVGSSQLQAIGTALWNSGVAWIGDPAQSPSNWGSIGKLTLGLEVLGLDPATFPVNGATIDLIASLRSAMTADGSFPNASSYGQYSQALAMLALARTSGGVPAQAVTWLEGQQCADATSPGFGSYGWSPDCSSPDPDVTSVSVQALEAAGVAETDPAVSAAVKWLAGQQDASGGFASFGDLNANSTGLAAQTLQSATVTKAAAGFIGGLQITCATLADHPDSGLDANDVGAIVSDQPAFASATTAGLTTVAGVVTVPTYTLMAATQAVLGLGGVGYASLSAAGAISDLPDRTCQASPDTTPTPTPSATPTQSATPTPTPSEGVSADTGGTAGPASGLPMLPGLAAVIAGLLIGAYFLRRPVKAR